METSKDSRQNESPGIRSYRTYEEWKPVSGVDVVNDVNFRSYRTYEEWKLKLSLRMST